MDAGRIRVRRISRLSFAWPVFRWEDIAGMVDEQEPFQWFRHKTFGRGYSVSKEDMNMKTEVGVWVGLNSDDEPIWVETTAKSEAHARELFCVYLGIAATEWSRKEAEGIQLKRGLLQV
jgi:hypothetical protein